MAFVHWLRAHNFTPDSSAKLMRRAPGKVRCNSCVCAHVISEGSERPAQQSQIKPCSPMGAYSRNHDDRNKNH